MNWSERTALWIIATGVIAAILYFLREPLTQFALALILWLAIDGLTDMLDRRLPFIPRWAILPFALVIVLGMVALIGWVVVSNISAMAGEFKGYGDRLNQILVQAHAALALPGEPATVETLLARVDTASVAAQVGLALQNLASNTIFILIYLGFLLPAAAGMSQKFDLIFRDDRIREGASDVVARIRLSMEQYLWVQTVMSLIITALTYLTLRVIGLENALFWSFLIFFLNYIPTIGSIVATVIITAVALVQFNTLAPVVAVATGVGVWQFVVGNFLQPRMTGDSLNLSAVVVLLALAIWGAIWGIAGAFLAAPLTVMLMIVLAQFRSTRWIAILLSADGKPAPRDASPSKSEED